MCKNLMPILLRVLELLTKTILCIFQSECLKEAFSELDMTSEVLQILMSPDNPYFRLSTFGHAGSTHVSFYSNFNLQSIL